MRVAHFDCFSGISGDMTLAALIDIGFDREAICSGIASLGLPIEISIEKVRKGGFASTFVEITAPEETTHRFLPDIEEILSRQPSAAAIWARVSSNAWRAQKRLHTDRHRQSPPSAAP